MVVEFTNMMHLAEKFNIIAFDTEFPGIAIQHKFNQDLVFILLRMIMIL